MFRYYLLFSSGSKNRTPTYFLNFGTSLTKFKIDIYEQHDVKFGNKILACLVISPSGRHRQDSKTVSESLRVFRDAIKAHRSLSERVKGVAVDTIN